MTGWAALDQCLDDADPRVRANAVETLARVGGTRPAADVRRALDARGAGRPQPRAG